MQPPCQGLSLQTKRLQAGTPSSGLRAPRWKRREPGPMWCGFLGLWGSCAVLAAGPVLSEISGWLRDESMAWCGSGGAPGNGGRGRKPGGVARGLCLSVLGSSRLLCRWTAGPSSSWGFHYSATATVPQCTWAK